MSKYSPINDHKGNDNEQELDNLVLPTYSNDDCTDGGSSQNTFEERLIALEAQVNNLKPSSEYEDEDKVKGKRLQNTVREYVSKHPRENPDLSARILEVKFKHEFDYYRIYAEVLHWHRSNR
ncbi:hypothetical protein CKK34_2716 [Yarrowia sp. E02]|nr:hypothetical protein CKK34_2716 [Yarrowia sp. E02]